MHALKQSARKNNFHLRGIGRRGGVRAFPEKITTLGCRTHGDPGYLNLDQFASILE